MSETAPANVTNISGLTLTKGRVAPGVRASALSILALRKMNKVTPAHVAGVSLLVLRPLRPVVSVYDGVTPVRRLLPGGWTTLKHEIIQAGSAPDAEIPRY